MKKYYSQILVVFAMIFSLSSCSETKVDLADEETLLISEVKNFIEAVNNKDIDSQMGYFPNEVFNSISRSDLKNNIKKSYESTDYPKITYNEKFSIDTLIVVGDTLFASIEMTMINTVDFSEFQGADGSDLSVGLSIESLNDLYGEENVFFNKEGWYAECSMPALMFARKVDSDWDIFAYSPLTESLIPSELLK